MSGRMKALLAALAAIGFCRTERILALGPGASTGRERQARSRP